VSCVGVVLAAGGSTRFGADKLLFKYWGKPLVWWAAEALRQGGLEVYVVTTRREVVQAVGEVSGVIYNPWWRLGLSTSVKAAVTTLIDKPCILWMPGDMPCVKPATVAAIAGRCMGGLVVPTYRGVRGNPVASCRDVYPLALALEGDVGLRALFGQVPVEAVEVEDPGILVDVDTPGDLERLTC